MYHLRVLTFNLRPVDLLLVPKLNGAEVYAWGDSWSAVILGSQEPAATPRLPLKTSFLLTLREEFILDLQAIEVPTETTGVVLEPAVQLHLLEEKGGQVSRPQSPAHLPEPLSLGSFSNRAGREEGRGQPLEKWPSGWSTKMQSLKDT